MIWNLISPMCKHLKHKIAEYTTCFDADQSPVEKPREYIIVSPTCGSRCPIQMFRKDSL